MNYRKNVPAEGAGRNKARFTGWLKERAVSFILAGIMFIGCCILAYPTFSDYWNSFHQSRAVISYADKVSSMNKEEYKQLIEEARSYNERLAKEGINWNLSEEKRAEYNELLNVNGEGVMGYITIPKIDVLLPVYHGTEEVVLQSSIGHLEQSSLPVGGESSHSMLSGHRGLPSARLFTDLDKLREGDTFTVTVLNETRTYEVDHVWIVEPNDFSHLRIEEGRELCTLITCTPYGVNTHRLLVQAHRIENADGDAMVTADAIQIRPVFIAPFLAVPILLLLLVYVLVSTSVKRRSRRDVKSAYLDENRLDEPELEIENKDVIAEAMRTFIKNRKDKNRKK